MYRDIRKLKQELRQKSLSYRRELSPETKATYDAAILEKVISLPEFLRADSVFTYVSKPIEADTFGILRAALAAGKLAAAPRCIPGTRNMEFLAVASEEDLFPGAFGVLEPDPARCAPLLPTAGTFCVVPGLCFDQEGFRLGYGKGYYDRFLSGFPGVTAGLCYCGCVRRVLPHGYYDRAVRFLVTERYVRGITGGLPKRRKQEKSR